MCTFTRTAFKMCGHTEYRGARCSPPVVQKHNMHELCKKTPIYLQSTKNGICTQCRTKNWEASMAKSSNIPDAKERHGNKGARPDLTVGCKDEVSHHVSTPATQHDNFQADTQKQDKAAKSNIIGIELNGRPRPSCQLTEHFSSPLREFAPRHQEPKIIRNKRKINANSEFKTSEQREALRGPRVLPGLHPTTKKSWNLIAVTKPLREDEEKRVGLHGPRDLPTTQHTIKEDWNLMTVTNPVRRGDGGKLRLRGPNPFPATSPCPTTNPAVNGFGARGRTACAPLVLQEVDKPKNRKVQEAAGEQFLHRLQDAIPPLPMSYKPILTGRHPLHRPLPPIPDENDPKPDTDDQPPPVPPHVVLHRRKAITLHAHDESGSPIERYSPAPDAPVGTYFGRETVHYGWQPARCDTVCSSFTE
ncbi:hypothetical protein NEUTE1DRAFT_110536 [Neurospora tetrasperma FGSC 2508]|uniref:Uncharacterized protein n=1 Tax=Neurospora tetrasperma (strain FGSC 2508 / ATCC MYA-4615 / P0657) TaxID=510951 RepID=F8MLK6_NEUT8|nr:uncharacterized protein NEUTE1DRAFT_110536 [Neurospora tetrasperma FGSC 2508]EGO58425.1 hypothetical protein NEUTE1DRAFT_110536 [Neurospora tetrasperma FGSC 2508]EGZ71241.1 hypothetical protein NEUTE2DRAFT_66212 [Neurospora tetrasperma FGSC 2509]